jgi:hypothetical protein
LSFFITRARSRRSHQGTRLLLISLTLNLDLAFCLDHLFALTSCLEPSPHLRPPPAFQDRTTSRLHPYLPSRVSGLGATQETVSTNSKLLITAWSNHTLHHDRRSISPGRCFASTPRTRPTTTLELTLAVAAQSTSTSVDLSHHTSDGGSRSRIRRLPPLPVIMVKVRQPLHNSISLLLTTTLVPHVHEERQRRDEAAPYIHSRKRCHRYCAAEKGNYNSSSEPQPTGQAPGKWRKHVSRRLTVRATTGYQGTVRLQCSR